MTYDFFRVVDAMHDDPTVYPVLSGPDELRPFEWEQADGQTPIEFRTKRVGVSEYTGNGWTQTKSLTDLTFTVCITDARVVVHCEKFTKGGGWWGFGLGGLAVAAVANVVSHARAAARRKGKVLVAQVRYPWVLQVAAPADRRGRRRVLRIVVNSGTDDAPVIRALDIGIDARSEPATWAASLAQLVATSRCESVAGAPLAACEAIADGTAQRAEPHWDLPGAVRVGGPGSLPQGAVAVLAAAPDAPELQAQAALELPTFQSVPAAPEPTVLRAAIAPPLAPANDATCLSCGATRSVPYRPCGRCGHNPSQSATAQETI